jgi:hypothetical protein
MTRAKHLSTATLATLALLWFAAPTAAQVRWHPDRGDWRGGYGYDFRSGPGFERGFDDGYREGRDAARDGRRYEPFREHRFRDAGHGYHRRYGSRELYRQDYRDGFRSGYARGYREAYRGYGRGYGYGGGYRRPW